MISLYLNRGISPPAPTNTVHPNVPCDDYCMVFDLSDTRENLRAHPEYNWPDSDVTLVAEDVAYLLHRSRLRRCSAIFNGIFEYDNDFYQKHSSPCIRLVGCSTNQLDAALSFIYPLHPGLHATTTLNEWTLIYDFAYAFQFDSLWFGAAQYLGRTLAPIDKICIGRRRHFQDLEIQGLMELSRHSTVPTSEEAKLLGNEGLLTIMRMRDENRLSIAIPVEIMDVTPPSPRKDGRNTGSEAIASPEDVHGLSATRSVVISDSVAKIDEATTAAVQPVSILPDNLPVRPSLPTLNTVVDEQFGRYDGQLATASETLCQTSTVPDSNMWKSEGEGHAVGKVFFSPDHAESVRLPEWDPEVERGEVPAFPSVRISPPTTASDNLGTVVHGSESPTIESPLESEPVEVNHARISPNTAVVEEANIDSNTTVTHSEEREERNSATISPSEMDPLILNTGAIDIQQPPAIAHTKVEMNSPVLEIDPVAQNHPESASNTASRLEGDEEHVTSSPSAIETAILAAESDAHQPLFPTTATAHTDTPLVSPLSLDASDSSKLLGLETTESTPGPFNKMSLLENEQTPEPESNDRDHDGSNDAPSISSMDSIIADVANQPPASTARAIMSTVIPSRQSLLTIPEETHEEVKPDAEEHAQPSTGNVTLTSAATELVVMSENDVSAPGSAAGNPAPSGCPTPLHSSQCPDTEESLKVDAESNRAVHEVTGIEDVITIAPVEGPNERDDAANDGGWENESKDAAPAASKEEPNKFDTGSTSYLNTIEPEKTKDLARTEEVADSDEEDAAGRDRDKEETNNTDGTMGTLSKNQRKKQKRKEKKKRD